MTSLRGRDIPSSDPGTCFRLLWSRSLFIYLWFCCCLLVQLPKGKEQLCFKGERDVCFGVPALGWQPGFGSCKHEYVEGKKKLTWGLLIVVKVAICPLFS